MIEEQFKVQLPGPDDQILASLGMDGDHMVVATRRNFVEADGRFLAQTFVYAFQRTNGHRWRYVRTLASELSAWENAATLWAVLEGGIAAIKGNDLRIFEFSTSNGWAQTARFPAASDHYLSGASLVIDKGTVVVGGPQCAWSAYRKDASARWTYVAGATDPTADELCFADLDVSASTIVAGVSRWYENRAGEVRIHTGLSPTPTSTLAAPGGDVYFGTYVAVDGNTLITSTPRLPGIRSYLLAGGQWQLAGQAATADAFVNQQNLNTPLIELNQEFVVGAYPFDAQRGHASGSVPVFRRNAAGSLTEVARLLASDAGPESFVGRDVAISGRRIAVGGGYAGGATVYVFELPANLTQPANAQDDFETGNYARWSPLAGSTFSVAATNRSRVLRQSSLTGDAGAYVSGMDWTNQSIQADVRATAFSGADRWVGLAVRRTDAANYYYLTLRASNVIQLRRMLKGRYQVIASAALPVALNRDYRLRLEAVGTWIRGYVDGALMVEARDTSHRHGQAGLQSYRARADYDNIVVTPNPQLTIAQDDFDFSADERWSIVDGDWQTTWHEETDEYPYWQSSGAGDARAVTGVGTDDQIIQVDMRAMTFGDSTNAWLGIMGRYVDHRNHYYVTLRKNGTISLRKLINGSIAVLSTANLSVVPKQWYRVRLEIVGNALRVFVDDRLMLQARDSTFAAGRYGLATYRTSAEFDDLAGWQP